MPSLAPLLFWKRTLFLCALSAGLAGGAACPARADDQPFQLDGGNWMSFDHYKDAASRGIMPPPAPPAAPAAAEQADLPSTASAAQPAMAVPTRPLDLPLMPGLNKGFNVNVSSTEDDSAARAAPVIAADAPTDIHLADKNWQQPASALGFTTNGKGEDEDSPPLDVRMSFLPDSKITPIPSDEHISAQHQARTALGRGAPPPVAAAKTPAETAACAAIDAYKQQQLTAIQSDRQTLKALQDAIAAMGLQKQLGFIAGSDSALNMTTTTSPLIDTPATVAR